MLACFG